MPTIRLKEGDFGSDTEVTVGLSDLYMPVAGRPGETTLLPFADIVTIESIGDDRSGQMEAALGLSIAGFRKAGPVGLLNGVLAVNTLKDVVFRAELRDGRAFVAVADAKTYANLHAEQIAARAAVAREGAPADAIIEKYIGRGPASASPLAAAMTYASPPSQPADTPPPEPVEDRRVLPDRRARPAFGRRTARPTR